MKRTKLGDIFYYGESLVKVISINDGRKEIGMERLTEKERCHNCDAELKNQQFDVIEESPLFQENTKPIETLGL